MSLIFGHHSVLAQLQQEPQRVRVLYLQKGRPDGRNADILALASSHGVRVDRVERRWLDSRVQGSHQGVAADCHALALATEAELEARWAEFGPAPLVLVLDGIMDPRNLGACLRTASAAGV
ncbi:MAG: RNA methyltransferase substrate-binding domain-containing protein, partial [Pseudomonadota bacterium]